MGSSSSDNDVVVFTGLTFPQITVANHGQNVEISCLKTLTTDKWDKRLKVSITLGEIHIYTSFS